MTPGLASNAYKKNKEMNEGYKTATGRAVYKYLGSPKLLRLSSGHLVQGATFKVVDYVTDGDD